MNRDIILCYQNKNKFFFSFSFFELDNAYNLNLAIQNE